MKIIVTGSLGYISKPLTQQLVEKGHNVIVISSSPERKNEIEAMGAKAAIGNMDDVDFLTDTFRGADAVYCMLMPYGNFADPNNDADAMIKRADAYANNYLQAIEKSGVKRVVYLSSIGADMNKDSGLIIVHHKGENTLNKLPSDVNISFMRPAGFYKNLFAFIAAIKHQDKIAVNYGGDDKVLFVSNLDIADAIVEELESQTNGRKVRYVASDEMTGNKAAGILGAAIGNPDLKWEIVTNEEQLSAMKAHGMNESIAANFTEMNASIHNGKFYEDYDRNKPTLGKVKLEDFAKEFAKVYNTSNG
ncbi:MAG: NAD(P)H-binding protein [Bacteroidota bacterium]|nr:NAD(P)H-binding protein [Bacteroidota bacterium]